MSDQRIESLTRSQLQVLELMAQGKLNKVIAAELSVTEPAVKNRVIWIFRKLQVGNRTQAVLIYLKDKCLTASHLTGQVFCEAGCA